MPAPIRPAPSTPSFATSRAFVPSGYPASFLISWVAKKTVTRARETSETASSPKALASICSPSASVVAVPCSTASMASRGAG